MDNCVISDQACGVISILHFGRAIECVMQVSDLAGAHSRKWAESTLHERLQPLFGHRGERELRMISFDLSCFDRNAAFNSIGVMRLFLMIRFQPCPGYSGFQPKYKQGHASRIPFFSSLM